MAPLDGRVESAYQEGQRLALHAATPLEEAVPALVLLFVSSRLRRAGSSSRQLRQDCNDGVCRSCTKSAGVPVGCRGRVVG